jgi:hypothetical protein
MFSLNFSTDNAAFCYDDEGTDLDRDAVADALRKLADKVTEGRNNGAVLDANGNSVGTWSLNP